METIGYIIFGIITYVFFMGIRKNYLSSEGGTYFTKYKPKNKLGNEGILLFIIWFVVLTIFGGIFWW